MPFILLFAVPSKSRFSSPTTSGTWDDVDGADTDDE